MLFIKQKLEGCDDVCMIAEGKISIIIDADDWEKLGILMGWLPPIEERIVCSGEITNDGETIILFDDAGVK